MNAENFLQIRVLGCSGGIVTGQHTTAFLINESVLIDAGTGVASLTIDEMKRIDHVFITHAHLDHVLCLPLLLDAVGQLRAEPVHVHALPETLASLRAHIFNGEIWPDFSVLPQSKPYMVLSPLHTGDVRKAGDMMVEAMPARHSVPAVGFAVGCAHGGPRWVFSGDTGPSDAFWTRLNQLDVGALVIETAFSDDEEALASMSGHMSPSVLAKQLLNIARGNVFPIYISHTKPVEAHKIMDQVQHAIRHVGNRDMQVDWLATGQRLTVPCAIEGV